MRRGSRILPLVVLIGAVALALTGPAGRFAVYTALLLLGPGYLIERVVGLDLPQAARPALWLGLSLAVLPPIYLWATQLGAAITPYTLFLGLLGLACALVWATTRSFEPQRHRAHRDFIVGDRGPGTEGRGQDLAEETAAATPPRPALVRANPSPLAGRGVARSAGVRAPSLWALLFLGVLALTAWTRVEHIRGMAFPPWVDAVHHALLIRIAGESGQAPISLRPYLPIDQSGYHWGYHVVAGALWRASGLEIPRLMLWLGQVLSTLTVVSVAGCALALFRRPAAAVVAGAIPGLFSLMPAYLLSWGRYTLLMGLLVLCAVIMVAAQLVQDPGPRRTLALGLLLAGLSLIHFVLFVFALAWCAACWLALAPGRQPARAFVGLLSAGLLVVAVTLPWLLLLARLARPGSGGSPLQVVGNDPHNALPESLFWGYLGRELLVLAALGAFWGLRRRSREALALVLWAALLALLTNPVLIGLPYVSFLTNLMLVSMVFVPVSLLAGAGAGFLLDVLSARMTGRAAERAALSPAPRAPALSAKRSPAGPGPAVSLQHTARSPGAQVRGGVRRRVTLRVVSVAATALALALLGWRARDFRGLINRGTTLAEADDLRAIAWVAAETPSDARFVVNTRPWMPEVARGEDGGWWLLPLAAREVSTPPALHNYGPDDYRAAVKEQTDWLRAARDPAPEEIAAFMRRYGYGYAYATSGGRQLRTERLAASPLFEQLYQDGRVAIFRLR